MTNILLGQPPLLLVLNDIHLALCSVWGLFALACVYCQVVPSELCDLNE